MKMELAVAHDFPLFGKKRRTGTVLGTFDIPDVAKGEVETAAQKLKMAVAGGHLVIRPAAPKKGNGGKDKAKANDK